MESRHLSSHMIVEFAQVIADARLGVPSQQNVWAEILECADRIYSGRVCAMIRAGIDDTEIS